MEIRISNGYSVGSVRIEIRVVDAKKTIVIEKTLCWVDITQSSSQRKVQEVVDMAVISNAK